KITKPVQLLDIMPTILELAGINTDKFILEGDSLLSLIREENQDFWDNRLVISEEVGYKHKKDRNEWGSIFYKDWHFVNSKQFFCISWAIEKLLKKENFPEFGLATKLFNNSKDKEEKYAIMTSIPDIFLKLKFRSIIHKLQDNNLKIWKAFTGGESSIATYDKEELDRLKALGYIN
ncbi:MAG: hypothetical protein KKB22_08110, partial [Candidatus Omnitrophica bacterium]|nr:hypothetical protein [Candidatus Omnitrophota bacterium]